MDKRELGVRFRTMQAIWLAQVTGVSMVALVVVGLLTVAGLGFGALEPRLLYLTSPVLLAVMFLGLAVGRRMETAIPRDLAPGEGLRRYQMARIVAAAMCEGAGLVIILMSMLSDQPLWALGGGAACLWFMFRVRPRRADAERFERTAG
jgi:hypothetical protein